MKITFVDTETVGLDPLIHDVWEVAVIVREDGHDTEHTWRLQPDLGTADARALEVGRYHERTSAPGWQWDDPETAARQIYAHLDGAVIVGSNPSFDTGMLAALFARHYERTSPWHYRAIDIVPLAAGFLYGHARQFTRRDCDATWYQNVADRIGWPWKSHETSEAIGVSRPAADVAHTALGDARWARDVWDMVTQPDPFYAASDEQLAAMASQALSTQRSTAQ